MGVARRGGPGLQWAPDFIKNRSNAASTARLTVVSIYLGQETELLQDIHGAMRPVNKKKVQILNNNIH